MSERRNFPREDAGWQVDIYENETTFTSTINNLSLGGAELVRPSDWNPEQSHFCTINFSIGNPSHTLKVKMKICWVTDSCVGLKYHEIEKAQKVKLNKILSQMARIAVAANSHFGM